MTSVEEGFEFPNSQFIDDLVTSQVFYPRNIAAEVHREQSVVWREEFLQRASYFVVFRQLFVTGSLLKSAFKDRLDRSIEWVDSPHVLMSCDPN